MTSGVLSSGVPVSGTPLLLPWVLTLALLAAACRPPAQTAGDIYRKAQAAYEDEQFEHGLSLIPSDSVLTELRASREVRDNFLALKGELLSSRGDYAGAIAILSPGFEAGVSPETDRRRRQALGLAQCRIAKTGAEQESGLKMLDQTLTEVVPRTREEGMLQLRRGVCLQRMSRSADAIKAYQAALAAARSSENTILEARSLSSLGNLAAAGERFDEAAAYARDAVRIATNAGNAGRQIARRTTDNLGWYYYELGDYDRALDTLQRFKAANDRERFINEQNRAQTLMEMGDLTKATGHWEAALAATRKLGDVRSQISVLQGLAALSYRKGNLFESARWNRDATDLMRDLAQPDLERVSLLIDARLLADQGEAEKATALYRRVLADRNALNTMRWTAHAGLGRVLASQGQPQLADIEFQKAIALVEQARSSLGQAEDRISFLSGRMEVYREAMIFNLQQKRPTEALRIAARSRARTLNESKTTVASRGNDVVIFYWLDDPSSYLWVVKGGTPLAHFRLPGSREIQDLIDRHNSFILRARDPLTENGREARQLFEMLIAPALPYLSGGRVLIAPDGGLHALSWDTLVAPNPDHYWVEDIRIALIPGLYPTPPAPSKPGRRVLLIGDPIASDPDFPRLQNAGDEMSRISSLFTGSSSHVTALRGPQATPASAREAMAAGADYVHFAAHATASRLRPLESAIILSPDGESSRLYARDSARIPQRPRLVTLSACQAAGARAFRGEGLVGFAWAFLGAGAENVVATLWQVDDASTPRLMEQMYRQILLGKDPADALREAKLAFLRSGSALRKPYFWAAFQHFMH